MQLTGLHPGCVTLCAADVLVQDFKSRKKPKHDKPKAQPRAKPDAEPKAQDKAQGEAQDEDKDQDHGEASDHNVSGRFCVRGRGWLTICRARHISKQNALVRRSPLCHLQLVVG